MSRRTWMVLCFGLLVASAFAIGRSVHLYRDGQSLHASLCMQLEQTRSRAEEIQRLRLQTQTLEVASRPQQDILAWVHRTFEAANLPRHHLQNLEADQDVALSQDGAATGLRQQSMALSMTQLLPVELGRFLEHWNAQQETWVPTRIELQHVRRQQEPADRYDVRMVLAATYLNDTEPAKPRSSRGPQPPTTLVASQGSTP